jgi:hypothetical protein
LEFVARMQSMTASRNDIDLTNRPARLRRLALALALGVTAAVVAYFVTKGIVEPDGITHLNGPGYANAPFQNAWKLIYMMTGLAGAIVFSVTLAIASRKRR